MISVIPMFHLWLSGPQTLILCIWPVVRFCVDCLSLYHKTFLRRSESCRDLVVVVFLFFDFVFLAELIFL